MSDKKIDLLDAVLAIEGQEPIELTINGHSLYVRRAHTGMQIVEWQNIEVKRTEAKEAIIYGEGTDPEKLEKLGKVGMTYLKDMLKFLTEEPTEQKDINAVYKLLEASSGQVVAKVSARIFSESGLFNDKGDHVPFIVPSETESSTDD